ncbi:hypothetical protein FHR75_002463 [Kineococcus radiotolerans]|uniref:Tetratricopeptide repeat protein n=2 Tax=Kineococcus radiotolerans TaxID=131568 RepID=A6WDB6_KINRD|nr:hypothetical protein [Kineococcus radiotolerans]ABS04805.1 hypothetical protein Krad_3341 [Kineococcus radiotolerans SRS30216 = ATCC BAA-149]MBB2901648.1 hypothetical protein [Kineococcus radiotolerans]
MGLLDRWRKPPAGTGPGTRPTGRRPRRRTRRADADAVDPALGEAQLREALREDPNDETAFDTLAELVRTRAALSHRERVGLDEDTGPDAEEVHRAADNAVWALAEELAQSPRAWRPLLVLGRLSLSDDHEAALRRLGIAAERDSSGKALAEALAVLRGAGMNDEALSLGVGHWRPRDHDVEAGRHLVAAAIDAGRLAEARRHLKALAEHPDTGRVEQLRGELEDALARADRARH